MFSTGVFEFDNHYLSLSDTSCQYNYTNSNYGSSRNFPKNNEQSHFTFTANDKCTLNLTCPGDDSNSYIQHRIYANDQLIWSSEYSSADMSTSINFNKNDVISYRIYNRNLSLGDANVSILITSNS